MTKISAELVKRLRTDTSAGMMDCKRALQESAGEITEAKAWLRKKGLAGAQAKASRTTEQGLVAICAQGQKKAVLLELNAETDFVARNASFQQFLQTIANRALAEGATNSKQLLSLPTSEGGEDSIESTLQNLIGTIGENMRLRRCGFLSVEQGLIVSYMHARIEKDLAESRKDNKMVGEDFTDTSMGKIGVVLALEGEVNHEALTEQGKAIAMHIAAAHPSVVSRDDLPESVIAQEKSILTEQARSNSPANAPIDKIVAGRMEKFFRSVVLQEQKYALDEDRSIISMLDEMSNIAGHTIRIKGFLRFALGEEDSMTNEGGGLN